MPVSRAQPAPRCRALRQDFVQGLEEHLGIGHLRERAGVDHAEAVGLGGLRGRRRVGSRGQRGVGLVPVRQVDHAARPPARDRPDRVGVGARGGERDVAAFEHRALERGLARAVPYRRRLAEREPDPRIPEVGDPRDRGATAQAQSGQMHAVGRRAREHRVDVAAREPRRRGPARARRPADVGVGQQPPVAQAPQAGEELSRALPGTAAPPPQQCRQRAAARNTHDFGPRTGPGLERRIGDPVVVRRRAHHGAIPAVLRQIAREAKHPMHAAAGERRIEVAQHQHPAPGHETPRGADARGVGPGRAISDSNSVSIRAMFTVQLARASTSRRLRARA